VPAVGTLESSHFSHFYYSSFDSQGHAFDQRLGHFLSGRFHDPPESLPRYLHSLCGLLLVEPLVVGQPQRLVFVYCEFHFLQCPPTVIVLDKKYERGLLGLDGFSHAYVFWWFDRNDTPEKRAVLQVHPMGNRDNPLTGVFATRSPVRPNLVALTLCKIVAVEESVVEVEKIDAFDNTPVIYIKPYLPGYDTADDADQEPAAAGQARLPGPVSVAWQAGPGSSKAGCAAVSDSGESGILARRSTAGLRFDCTQRRRSEARCSGSAGSRHPGGPANRSIIPTVAIAAGWQNYHVGLWLDRGSGYPRYRTPRAICV
jgi:tRNA-Thr(GGU) m(6)t(6)A37 methyltransferase TsaA